MSAKKLTGKVAVVTGASKGIGASIAKQLATEGAAVIVNYASSRAVADSVVNEITKSGGKAVAVQGDTSFHDISPPTPCPAGDRNIRRPRLTVLLTI